MAETKESSAQEKAGTVIPELDELKSCIRAIKDENPDQGIAKVSQDRVKKILSETVVLVDGKPKKGLVNKSDPTISSKELAKQKTEIALAKKKEAARQKNAVVGGVTKPDTANWRPGGDISH